MDQRLRPEEIDAEIAGSAWRRDGDALVRDVELEDFAAALAFVVRVGAAAEAADHHPDIHLHDYRHVALRLTTHAAGGVTARDLALAGTVDRL